MIASAGAAGVVDDVLGADVAVVPAIEIAAAAAAAVGGDVVVVVVAVAAAAGDVVAVEVAAVDVVAGDDVVVVVAAAAAAAVAGDVVIVIVVVVVVVVVVVAAAADVVVAVLVLVAAAAAAACGAVSLPTLHRGIHRTRCQSGEDTYCTQGTWGNHDAVQHHWANPMGYVKHMEHGSANETTNRMWSSEQNSVSSRVLSSLSTGRRQFG